jgi:hypothetical protein
MTILFFKVATISLDHDLDLGPEGGADLLHKGLAHGRPLLLNGGLEAIDTPVEDSTVLDLNIAPDHIIQW